MYTEQTKVRQNVLFYQLQIHITLPILYALSNMYATCIKNVFVNLLVKCQETPR